MSDFRYEVEIHVSPARVWSVLLDVERWPEWTTSVSRIQRMEVGPLTLGSRTRIWQPRLMPAVWCVTSLDDRRRVFGWTTRAFGVKIVGRHQVETFKNHSRVSLSLHYTGPLSAVVARVYRSLIWDYLTREGDGLKQFCENLPANYVVSVPARLADEIHPTAQTS
ncbi:SRPBCC family protein [Occallatibacter savannae]|uniref:SRPBCC family protein n=1 Tax=Occallatibacter savannae TaxID=1002691 RepID=UPI000D686DAF|nr:SRPBCC family protein [Occallatibacter savannae]